MTETIKKHVACFLSMAIILISSFGTINIHATVGDDYSDVLSSAEQVQLNSPFSASIDTLGDKDSFKFTPSKTQQYFIYTLSIIDTYGGLYNSATSTTPIQTNDDYDTTKGRDFGMKATLNAGTTYYIKVGAYNDESTGSYSLLIIDDKNMAAKYSFEETSGTTVLDSTINAKNGTLTGTVTRGAGVTGGCADLDGSSGYVDMPDGMLSSVSNFTIAAWINVDKITSFQRLFDFGSSTSVYMYLTPHDSSGKMKFSITKGGTSTQQAVLGTYTFSVGTWAHVAVTLSGSTCILYVNGVEVGRSTSVTLKPSDLGSTTNNYIGKSQWSTDPYFDGKIDDFRIYKYALTSTELLNIVTNKDLISHYKFDEDSGNVAYNVSTESYDAVMPSSPRRYRGAFGNCIDLDKSVPNYVKLPQGITNQLTGFTFSAWVNLDTMNYMDRLFEFNTSSSKYMYLTTNDNANSASLRFVVNTGSGEKMLVYTADWNAPTKVHWVHVAVTYSYTVSSTGTVSGLATIYFGGTRRYYLTSGVKLTDLGSSINNYIGKSQFNNPYLDGKIDDVRIYNRALSQSELTSVFNEYNQNITVFENGNYSGSQAGLWVGTWKESDLIDKGMSGADSISSLKIPQGYKVTLYEGDEFTGNSIVKTADDASLTDDDFDNKISSLTVEYVSGLNEPIIVQNENIALGKYVSASSSTSPYVAQNINDGTTKTLWKATAGTGTTAQTVTFGLGAPYVIEKVRIKWEGTDYAKTYDVQCINNNSGYGTYSNLTTTTVKNGSWDEITVTSRAVASSIKLCLNTSNTTNYAISEIQILGSRASTLESGKLYHLISRNSSLYLDIDGSNVVQSSYNKSNSQIWKFVETSDKGWYELINYSTIGSTNKCLELSGTGTNNGDVAKLGDYSGSDNEKWYISPEGFETFKIVSKSGRKLLSVQNNSNSDGSFIIQSDNNGDNNQVWTFVEADPSFAPPAMPPAFADVKFVQPNLGLNPDVCQKLLGESHDLNYGFSSNEITMTPSTKNIILAIDISGSMANDDNDKTTTNTTKTKLYGAKEAAKAFVNHFSGKAGINIGIVPYQSFANNPQSLLSVSDTANVTTLVNKIDGLTTSTDGRLNCTGIGDALRMSYYYLNSAVGEKYVILMTDGVPTNWTLNSTKTGYKMDDGNISDVNYLYGGGYTDFDGNSMQYALVQGSRLYKSNIKTCVVGFGLINYADDQLEALAQACGTTSVASYGTKYHYITQSADEIKNVYNKIAAEVGNEATLSFKDVSVYQMLPSGVSVLEKPDGFDVQTDLNGISSIIGTLSDVILQKQASGNYKVIANPFAIKVKYNSTGTKTYTPLEVKYQDPFGNNKTSYSNEKSVLVESLSIVLHKDKLTIRAKKMGMVDKTVVPEWAPNEAKVVTWTSSDPSIATVDETGKVYGVKAGKVTITATIQYMGKTYTDTCKLYIFIPDIA